MGPKAQKVPLTTKRKREIAAGREREIAAGRERDIAAGRERDAVLHSIRVDLDSNAWPKKQLQSVAAHKDWRKGGLLKVDGSQVSDDENEQVPKVQLRSCISFKGSPLVGGLLKPDGSELSPDVSDDEGLGSASSSCTTSVPRKKPAKQDRCAAKNDPALFKPPQGWHREEGARSLQAPRPLDRDICVGEEPSGACEAASANRGVSRPLCYRIANSLGFAWAGSELLTLNCEGTSQQRGTPPALEAYVHQLY